MIMNNYCKQFKADYDELITVRAAFNVEKNSGKKEGIQRALKLEHKFRKTVEDLKLDARIALAKRKDWSYVGDFHEGIAVAKGTRHKINGFYYIERSGNIISESVSAESRVNLSVAHAAKDRDSIFNEGIGIATDMFGKRTFLINRNGIIIQSLIFGSPLVKAGEVKEGYCPILTSNMPWCFLRQDKNKIIAIEPISEEQRIIRLNGFTNGIARVDTTQVYSPFVISYYVNTEGKRVKLPGMPEGAEIIAADKTDENLMIVASTVPEFFIFNRALNKAVPLKLPAKEIVGLRGFNSDICVVECESADETGINEKREQIYINAAGEPAFGEKSSFNFAGSFSNGLAAVLEESVGNYYYINEMGEKAFEKEFLEASEFENGIAWVSDDGLQFYCIDTNGEPAFDDKNFKTNGMIDGFVDGVALVFVGKEAIYIDRRGRKVF
jgi:hypothetical protein